MRYITIIIVIVVYWFLLGFGLNLLLRDEFILSAAAEGNSSFNLVNTTDINMTTDLLDEDVSLRSFPNALKIMFTFRTPIPTAIPQVITSVLSFINWFLLVLLGISVYRVVNPLA